MVQIKKTLFITDFSLAHLTPQTAIFGFHNVIPTNYFVLFYQKTIPMDQQKLVSYVTLHKKEVFH